MAPSLQKLFAGDPLARMVRRIGPNDQDEMEILGGLTMESSHADASTVDGGPFAVFDVPSGLETGFTHYLDGAQKARLAMYYGLVPISVAHTSAAILERDGRALKPPVDYRSDFAFFVPTVAPIGDRLHDVLPVRVVPVDEDATSAQMHEAVMSQIGHVREDQEDDLARSFEDGVLLVDGGIGKALGSERDARSLVGLIKSHRRQYFRSADRVEKILGMRPGQRTSLFYRERDEPQGHMVASFYLKLHEQTTGSPLFGLVRIEVPPTDRMIARADEIAGWLMTERAPSSKPDARHDRLLYPIRLVEQHLKARQPSEAAVQALIGV
ncbi:MAG TPA: hypothetical protein PLH94_10770 [Fimbriimonadaceae bacterium]|nr:hypothetical protein [Fimbriimonadaceae bacterium]